jgi:blocked-early-in-transport protein 1
VKGILLVLSQTASSPTKNPSTRQNNDSLASLQAKVSQLRSVTVDIYDNARDQHVIDNTSESFSNMTTSIKGSARRLGVMASQGNKVAVFKLAGIIIATVVVLWWILSWFW